jgi:hypothetical protein
VLALHVAVTCSETGLRRRFGLGRRVVDEARDGDGTMLCDLGNRDAAFDGLEGGAQEAESALAASPTWRGLL